ncbi:MAG: hypothetical protein C0483_07170 [Pirellula sp.]|nr:hypothetical protein [Pirellula sp.]
MVIEELVVLLPCHSLEDFPVHHEGEEAEGLLAAWSGLWHPALIAACDNIPLWFRADAPPENPRPRIIVIPQVSDTLLLPGWPTRAKSEGAKLIRKTAKRTDVVAACLAVLDKPSTVPDHIVADFYALGTGYLLVELLTRQMRYMSNLDEVRFQNEAREAARAAVENRIDEAQQHLKNAFETLYEARERFYPVDNYLIDLTLTADTTLGPALRQELSGDVPLNVLISGALVDRLAEREPESLAALRHAIDRRIACVVGGEYDERETPLLPIETILDEFRRGRAAYQRHLDLAPKVYGRRKQGLSPLVPQIVARSGFEGALSFTLDDGVFPTPDQCKTRWEGFSNDAIDALGRTPLDAAQAESFLDLPRKVGDAMDRDYVATTVFAHWPGATSDYYDDLRRMATYVPLLGKFVTLTDYFDHTERPGQISKFTADRYRTTFLRQAVVRNTQNPVTWAADALHRRLQVATAATLQTMAEAVTLRQETESAASLMAEVDQSTGATLDIEAAKLLDQRVATAVTNAASSAASAVCGRATNEAAESLLLLNSQLGSRRELVDVSSLARLPEVGGPVAAVQESGSQKFAVVDVPSMGFAWLAAGPTVDTPPPRKSSGLFGLRKGPKPLVEANILRNELVEVHLSELTGGIKGLFVTGRREKRVSQQLAFRLPQPRPRPGDPWRDPDLEPIYSTMVCERWEPTIVGPTVGELTSYGKLVDAEGKRLAGFTQRLQIAQGSPLVTLEIDLDIEEQPRAEAWGSYYAARFAWGDPTTELSRGVFGMQQPTSTKRPESPHFIELKTETTSTLLLPDGLPHHLLTGERMLDTLLIGKGETRRKFRFGIIVESAHPAADAQAFMSPLVPVLGAPRPASGATGWLFFVDAKNFQATHWESIVEADKVVGFRVRLLETEGLSGQVELRTIRAVREAKVVNLCGETLLTLAPTSTGIPIDVGPYEWLELEARY